MKKVANSVEPVIEKSNGNTEQGESYV